METLDENRTPTNRGQAGQHLGNLNAIPISDGVVDLVNAEVRYREGGRCALSQREVQLLSFLARRPGVPISRDELLAEVWRVDPARIVTRTVDMHVSNLRHKLHHRPDQPALLTVRGHGYMLTHHSGNSAA